MSPLSTTSLVIAELSRPVPLFGNQWLALLAVLGGVAVLMFLVAAVGRWLAATHPDPVAKKIAAPFDVASSIPAPIGPEILAVIAAAVTATYGSKVRIADVKIATPAPSVEVLMTQWAIEGRRQIYTSHKVR